MARQAAGGGRAAGGGWDGGGWRQAQGYGQRGDLRHALAMHAVCRRGYPEVLSLSAASFPGRARVSIGLTM